jgi:hypothetical protein
MRLFHLHHEIHLNLSIKLIKYANPNSDRRGGCSILQEASCRDLGLINLTLRYY